MFNIFSNFLNLEWQLLLLLWSWSLLRASACCFSSHFFSVQSMSFFPIFSCRSFSFLAIILRLYTCENSTTFLKLRLGYLIFGLCMSESLQELSDVATEDVRPLQVDSLFPISHPLPFLKPHEFIHYLITWAKKFIMIPHGCQKLWWWSWTLV